MLTLHHLNHSRSFRILWLLCELNALYGTPFEVITHTRNKNHLAPDELKSIHPMGKAPILVDNNNQKTLIESGFMIEYLLKYYDKDNQLSPDNNHWEEYAFWLHFGESTMMPPLVTRLVMGAVATKSPLLVRPIAKAIADKVESLVVKDNIKQSFGLLDNHLKDKEWLAEKFTGADIQVYFTVKALQSRGGIKEWANVQKWLTACESCPSFKQAVEMGGALFS